MSTTHLSADEFFTQLAELFDGRRKKDHGSVFLTQKSVTRDRGPNLPPKIAIANSCPDPHPSEPLPILIRATDGNSKGHKAKKIKFSTVVEADMLDTFFARYAEICKSGMSGLKKRDRSKGKKKMKAKKRKGGAANNGMDDARKS